jgi:NADH-quinone oxidoreductase subunit H
MWMFMFLFVWVRGTLLRLRYDQFMKFGWKVLIPAALTWVVMVAVVQGVRQFTTVGLRPLLVGVGVVVLVAYAIAWYVDWRREARREQAPEAAAPSGEFDPFAGGYPVPPLPGQQLPPSPRRRARVAATAGAPAAAAPQPDHDTEVPRG